MQVFHVGFAYDDRARTSKVCRAVEVLLTARSRMDATVELRELGFSNISSRMVHPSTGYTDVDGRLWPVVAPGEVWTRDASCDANEWVRW